MISQSNNRREYMSAKVNYYVLIYLAIPKIRIGVNGQVERFFEKREEKKIPVRSFVEADKMISNLRKQKHYDFLCERLLSRCDTIGYDCEIIEA